MLNVLPTPESKLNTVLLVSLLELCQLTSGYTARPPLTLHPEEKRLHAFLILALL